MYQGATTPTQQLYGGGGGGNWSNSRHEQQHQQRHPMQRTVIETSALPQMAESPMRSSSRTMHVTPFHGSNTDWEGVASLQRSVNSNQAQQRGWVPPGGGAPRGSAVSPGRSSSPSVSVLRPAADQAKLASRRFLESTAEVRDGPQHLLDHQAFLEWRREEYKKRLDAEARGELYQERRPYSESFVKTLPAGGSNNLISIDFVSRSRKIFNQPQVLGTKEEIAWLKPPEIPPPVGWNGYWDLCSGHEYILQIMAVSGANAENSPSLTQHFMYPELLSAVQRLQYGAYLVHYSKSEPPHERYFYVKPLPLANKAQYCPFLCWSTHRHSHNALDAIPLCNVMWVTQGLCSTTLMKHSIGGDYIEGPFVGKKRAELLVHGVFTVWVYDGRETKAIDLCATDPLVFAMFMKLMEDVAQLNASLDSSGSVRALQRDIEKMREDGSLAERGKKRQQVNILGDQ
jgi:hypothetical protein